MFKHAAHTCMKVEVFFCPPLWGPCFVETTRENMKPYLYCTETRSTRCHTFGQTQAAEAFIRKPSCLFSPKTEIVFSLFFLRRSAEYIVCLDGKSD